MKKTKSHCLLKYLYYIALFILAYFLVRFILNQYNQSVKIEEFTGLNENSKIAIITVISILVGGAFILHVGRAYFKAKRMVERENRERNDKFVDDVVTGFQSILKKADVDNFIKKNPHQQSRLSGVIKPRPPKSPTPPRPPV